MCEKVLLSFFEILSSMFGTAVVVLCVLATGVAGEKALSKADTDILNTLGGPDYVMVVIFTAAVVFILVLLVKRQLLRILLISKRGAHTAIGSGAPKKLSHEIQASIRRVEKLKIEPRTLAENIQSLSSGGLQSQTHPGSVHDLENLRFRFKAIDSMTYLDDLLCSVDVHYCRKSHQTVREHLKSLQTPPRAPLAGTEAICDSLVKLYEHARYGKKEFGEREYKQLANHVGDLETRLRQTVTIPGTLVSTDTAGSSPKVTGASGTQAPRGTVNKPTTVVYRSPSKTGPPISV